MSRPTKEEAAQWARTLDGVTADVLDFSRRDAQALAGFLRRVAAALPSAAAVQRDRERRSRPRPVKASENDEGPIDPRHLPSQEE